MLLAFAGGPAAAECRLCAPRSEARTIAPVRPLAISVDSSLDLGRAAQGRGGGSIALDERGARRVAGLIDLGGVALSGRVRLTGEPFARVRVSLPTTMRLLSPDGGAADVVDVRADVPPAIVLGPDGSFEFGFGGRLDVPAGVAGDLRGRFAITADYE